MDYSRGRKNAAARAGNLRHGDPGFFSAGQDQQFLIRRSAQLFLMRRSARKARGI
jgi:hypothetical protein